MRSADANSRTRQANGRRSRSKSRAPSAGRSVRLLCADAQTPRPDRDPARAPGINHAWLGTAAAEKCLGFRHFGIPLRQLFRGEKSFDARANRAALVLQLVHDIFPRHPRMAGAIILEFLSCTLESGPQMILLVIGQIQILCEAGQLASDGVSCI